LRFGPCNLLTSQLEEGPINAGMSICPTKINQKGTGDQRKWSLPFQRKKKGGGRKKTEGIVGKMNTERKMEERAQEQQGAAFLIAAQSLFGLGWGAVGTGTLRVNIELVGGMVKMPCSFRCVTKTGSLTITGAVGGFVLGRVDRYWGRELLQKKNKKESK